MVEVVVVVDAVDERGGEAGFADVADVGGAAADADADAVPACVVGGGSVDRESVVERELAGAEFNGGGGGFVVVPAMLWPRESMMAGFF